MASLFMWMYHASYYNLHAQSILHRIFLSCERSDFPFLSEVNVSTLCSPQAVVNTQQGFLNCLVYGQHRQFASFCSHVLSLGRSNSAGNINDYDCTTGRDVQQRHDERAIHSRSQSGVRIPVSEISPLLQADSPRTPLEPSPSQVPFPVKLLGEFAR